MTTAIQDKTSELFTRAALSDDDLGYPTDVAFVPGDQPWTERVVWRTLRDERRPVVLVVGDGEILIEPADGRGLPRLVDWLRGRVRVRVDWHGREASDAARVSVGRHALADLPRLPTLA